MSNLSSLKPSDVWKYFDQICQIPRPSKQEEKIVAFLMQFAQEHKLEAKCDEVGNVVIFKPATPGMEGKETAVLQSHLDMVCEKNSDVSHNFEMDPIQAYIDGAWVKAKGTTLGADDGIGVAAQLALLASTNVPHGPIECLFTIDEETGLTGAFELKEGFFTGKYLLNLDSEDEGELFIGCAGGLDTVVTFDYEKAPVPTGSICFRISVSGLKGGHSGDDIDKGLGNSIKLLTRFLWRTNTKYDLRLAKLEGGNLRNAIPREAYGVFTIHQEDVESMQNDFATYFTDVKNELKTTEPNIDLKLEKIALPEMVIDETTQYDLLNSLYACPHGVIAMSRDIPGLVETSTNLAAVKFIQDNQILISTSQRSSVSSSIKDIAYMVESVFRLANAKVVHSDGYPGWAPNTNSAIMGITVEAYKRLFKTQPQVRAIHAGLECGLFLEKYPVLDMISFGPTIKGAHSPDERLEIATVEKFWLLMLEVLKNMPSKK
ncbi:aminoacyl-histidine dipeptidase [Williamwhitmania taraxaci]|uniref:Cytosol non-specific dipeptidase n=1 Tax=Williamwhitmania taraxaci TaxID=1640674 RepID=A0A1G6GMU4_9BACT|nr:aminoacyl-histidine dipeptidase [Williamwhitmania taraxaci]SDB83269.1 dipeptidase D [Williamwhitmania taraxaci]